MIIRPIVTRLMGVALFAGISTGTSSAALFFFLAPDQFVEVDGSVLNDSDTDSAAYTLGTANTTRKLTQTVIQVDGGGSTVGTLSTIEDNAWLFSTGPSTASSGSVEWGADAPLNLNLYSYGDRFVFEHDWSDSDSPVFTLSIWVNGVADPYSQDVTLSATNTSINHTFLFSSFGGADFSNVDRISIEIVGQIGNDVSIRDFQVIPESSTALLVGGAAFPIFLRRRRSA